MYSGERGGSACLPGAERHPSLARRKVVQGLLPFRKLPLIQEAHLLLCGHSSKSHHTAMRQMSPSKGASHTSVHNCTCHGLPPPEPAPPSLAHSQPSLWLLVACLLWEAVGPACLVPWEWTRCLPEAQTESVPRKSGVPFVLALTPHTWLFRKHQCEPGSASLVRGYSLCQNHVGTLRQASVGLVPCASLTHNSP